MTLAMMIMMRAQEAMSAASVATVKATTATVKATTATVEATTATVEATTATVEATKATVKATTAAVEATIVDPTTAVVMMIQVMIPKKVRLHVSIRNYVLNKFFLIFTLSHICNIFGKISKIGKAQLVEILKNFGFSSFCTENTKNLPLWPISLIF